MAAFWNLPAAHQPLLPLPPPMLLCHVLFMLPDQPAPLMRKITSEQRKDLLGSPMWPFMGLMLIKQRVAQECVS
jgi:hypothetical protein